MKKIIQLVIKRWKSETPKIAKAIQKVLKKVVATSVILGLAIYTAETNAPSFLPEIVIQIGQWCSGIGVIGGALGIVGAQLTTSEPKCENKNEIIK